MKQKLTITIPESLEDITVRQMAQYLASDLTEDSKALETALNIFCGIPANIQSKVTKTQLEDLARSVMAVLNERPTFRTTFEYNGKKWGFIPNLNEITAGEYIDAESYIGDWSNMHKALAVLYRPITKESRGWYLIEPYEGSDKYAKELQDAPASIAVACQVFFWTIAKDLLNASLQSLRKVEAEAGLTDVLTLTLGGVGILPSSTLQAETLWYVSKLLSYRFKPS